MGKGAVDVVGGRYRLLEVIGTGGMGRVWRAEDSLLLREVAVKETEVLADQSMREARAAARLDHPGVVKVFDVVRQGDRSWIVMEYVRSRSLHEVVRADGPLAPHEVARIGLDILAALRAAHAAGVLHRDVKPHNVLIRPDGRAVLGDFGLATIGGWSGGPDPLLGSPNYIAPERISLDEAGVPADLFSLGATLYAAVEGRPPFARGETALSLRALLEDPPDPPQRAGALSGILLDLLAKEPGARPDAAGLDRRLRGVTAVRGRAVAPPPPKPRAARIGRFALAGAAVALVAGGVAVAADAHRPEPVPPAVAAVAAGTFNTCGFAADAEPVRPATTGVPAGIPEGWIWFRDPTGFSLALPSGWRRSTAGNDVCFGDPSGQRSFTVNMIAVVTRQPLAYWQNREKADLAAGTLPGYRRISMGVLLFKRGAADWEYTYRPDSDTTLHERRVLAAVTAGRSYLLRWTVADAGWAGALAEQRRMMDLFASAR